MLVKPPTSLLRVKNFDDLVHMTRNVDSFPDNPSRHVVEHFKALSGSMLKKENACRGKWFEACVLDYFLLKGIQPELVTLGKDVAPPYNAEIDIRIENSAHVELMLLKTSVRERWKQWDRDANLAKHKFPKDKVRIVGLLYNEHEGNKSWEAEKNAKLANKVGSMCWSLDNVITVLDEKTFNEYAFSVVDKFVGATVSA